MENIIRCIGTEIYQEGGHKGFLIQWSLISPLCKKWCYNRDPDMERVKEIYQLQNEGHYIPKIIHLAECEGAIDGGTELVCYDGNHRREAWNMCSNKEFLCVVDIMFQTNHDNIYKAFVVINKAVQVPDIYMSIPEECKNTTQQQQQYVKNDILELVKMYEHKYKAFVSTSARYHSPNFNRDALIDNLFHIYQSVHEYETRQVVEVANVAAVVAGENVFMQPPIPPPLPFTVVDLQKLLSMLNEEYKNQTLGNSHSKYKDTVLEKCRKHNMYLFLERTIPIEHVYLVLSKLREKKA